MRKQTFSSYEDFQKTFAPEKQERFNFAFDVMDALAAETPERTALVHVDNAHVRRDYSFADLSKDSSRLANALAERGLAKGDRVMLVLYRRYEWWVAMLALHKLGAVAIPSPSLLTTKDMVYRLNTAEAKAAIVEDSIVKTMDPARAEAPSLGICVQVGEAAPLDGWLRYEDIVPAASDSFPRPADAACDEDPLLIFFTSGTTGMPKMVEHSHRYPYGHIITGLYWHDLGPDDLHLTLADTGWGKAVWGKFYGQWFARATVFVFDFRGKFDPAELLQIMAEHKVTSFCGPPTVYRFLVRQDLSQYDLSALRHCTTAGELLNDSVFIAWKEATGLPIYEGYGQTETTLQIATLPFMEPKPGSIGRPAPGWDIVLLNAEDQICPPGEEGEICIRLAPRPDGLFKYYLGEPERTASVLSDTLYRTGDKAWMDEDGYIWFLGRVDDLIKSSGYRIGPFEVESALVAHEAVVEAAVTGVPDEVRGQAVKATIVLAPGFEPSEELTKAIQNHVKKITAPYKYPRIVEYVAELPKTISGKIKRAEIRERDLKKQS